MDFAGGKAWWIAMVNFVGAGCGAPDLITLRGARLLGEADVIIYAGSLVNPELLKYAGENCEIYNSAYLTLDEVTDIIASAEEKGKMTVRLHTGDPSIYGALREQTERLDKLGIKYEICPGVSSLCGAAAAMGREYTVPGVSQSVIITRMAGRTAVPERESISSFAAHGAAMVIFLSAGMIKEVSEELIRGGYLPETPAAIVYKASWPDERVIMCTVGDMARRAEKGNIKNTALICVGEFLGEKSEPSRLYDKAFETSFRKAKK